MQAAFFSCLGWGWEHTSLNSSPCSTHRGRGSSKPAQPQASVSCCLGLNLPTLQGLAPGVPLSQSPLPSPFVEFAGLTSEATLLGKGDGQTCFQIQTQLWNLRQVAEPLWTSVSSSVQWVHCDSKVMAVSIRPQFPAHCK